MIWNDRGMGDGQINHRIVECLVDIGGHLPLKDGNVNIGIEAMKLWKNLWKKDGATSDGDANREISSSKILDFL